MLQKDTKSYFASDALSCGDKYFKNNNVHFRFRSEEHATFSVFDSGSSYECELSWKNHVSSKSDFLKSIKLSCSCPYSDEYHNCKHLWASIRLGDSKGFWNEVYYLLDRPPSLTKTTVELKKHSGEPKKKPWEKKLNDLKYKNSSSSSSSSASSSSSYISPQEHSKIYYSLEVDSDGDLSVGFFIKTNRSNRADTLVQKTIRANRLLKYSHADQELIWMLTNAQMDDLLYDYNYDPDHDYDYDHDYDPDHDYNHNYNYAFKYGEIGPYNRTLVLKHLCESGRFFKGSKKDVYALDEVVFLEYDDILADLKVKVLLKNKDNDISVEGLLETGSTDIPLKALKFIHLDGIYISENKIGRLDGPFLDWIDTLIELEDELIPKADADLLVQALFSYDNTPAIELDPKLGWKIESERKPTPKFIINDENEKGYQTKLYGKVVFEYDDAEVSSLSSQKYATDSNNKTLFERNRREEFELLKVAEKMGMSTVPQKFVDLYNFRILVEYFVSTIKSFIGEGWIVEAHGNKVHTAHDFDFSVSSGVDWFDLEGGVTFDSGQTITLPELMRTIKSGEKLIPLGNGQCGMLPENWLEKYANLVEIGNENDNGSLRFTRTQGIFLNSWFSGTNDLKNDKGFSNFQKTLKKARLKKKLKPLKAFHGKLRDYQEEGLSWLEYIKDLRFGGILADDMGLGKTVQIIAFLQKNKQKMKMKMKGQQAPNLIVVPRSLVFNWKDEIERFAPNLTALNYIGAERVHTTIEDIKSADVVITTYHTLRNDFEKLRDILFSYVILDEAQNIKNSKAKISQACKALSSEHKLALTGTPIENSISDLFSILDFVNPGLISEKLKYKFSNTSEGSEDLTKLSKALGPMILRRTKKQVLTDLPDKVESTIKCELTKSEKKRYDDLKKYYQMTISRKIEEKGFSKSKIEILEALLRLRQAACHPSLIDKENLKLKNAKSAKLDILFEQINSLASSGNKCLVFSQFTSFLKIIKPKLEKEKTKYLYLDGQTRNRKELVEKFESSNDTKVFLISLKAGGVGLNLTSANYVFILDPWWNPAVESQAIDRTHRIGQKNNVFAYKLISKDTVEEKILELQKNKKTLSDAVINSQTGMLKKMNMNDLNFLLS